MKSRRAARWPAAAPNTGHGRGGETKGPAGRRVVGPSMDHQPHQSSYVSRTVGVEAFEGGKSQVAAGKESYQLKIMNRASRAGWLEL